MPLVMVIESFRPYIESKIAGMSVPGMDRDDLRQEAYVALLSAVGSYDEKVGSRFSTYAIACINNRFADTVKAASRQNEEYCDLRERIETLLSDKERRALRLWLRGYGYDEIGEILGITPKSVGNALQRARRKLKK